MTSSALSDDQDSGRQDPRMSSGGVWLIDPLVDHDPGGLNQLHLERGTGLG